MNKKSSKTEGRGVSSFFRGASKIHPFHLIVAILLGGLSSATCWGQGTTELAPKLDPAEILRSSRAIFIAGNRNFPPEPLEKKLFENKDFLASGLVIVQDRQKADLIIELEHQGGINRDFTYRMIHPATDVVLGSGKVIAWDSIRAAPGLAGQISKRIKQLRTPPKR